MKAPNGLQASLNLVIFYLPCLSNFDFPKIIFEVTLDLEEVCLPYLYRYAILPRECGLLGILSRSKLISGKLSPNSVGNLLKLIVPLIDGNIDHGTLPLKILGYFKTNQIDEILKKEWTWKDNTSCTSWT
jgi:hypothetical protein